jgi:hypothetical protein
MATVRGPAFTFTRVFSRASMALAASDMFLSDARLSSSPPTCAVNTRSPSIEISSWCANSRPVM